MGADSSGVRELLLPSPQSRRPRSVHLPGVLCGIDAASSACGALAVGVWVSWGFYASNLHFPHALLGQTRICSDVSKPARLHVHCKQAGRKEFGKLVAKDGGDVRVSGPILLGSEKGNPGKRSGSRRISSITTFILWGRRALERVCCSRTSSKTGSKVGADFCSWTLRPTLKPSARWSPMPRPQAACRIFISFPAGIQRYRVPTMCSQWVRRTS